MHIVDPVAAPFLLDTVLKATVLLLAAGLATLALRRRSAATRHLVWSVALGSLVALPLCSLVLPRWAVPLPVPAAGARPQLSPPPSAPSAASFGTALGARQASSPALAATPAPVAARHGAAPPEPAPEVTDAAPLVGGLGWATGLLLWALGVLGIAAWMLSGQWGVWRLSRRAERVRDPAWLRLVQDVATQLGIRRPVSVVRSERAGMPATWGLLWPTVLLPADTDEWSAERRRVIVLHELAHVKRLDCLTQLLAQFACALYWFHPGVWYAARRLRVERERACDDRVIGSGTRAADYADHLLQVARRFRALGFATPATVSMAKPSQLEGRLLAVLDTDRDHRGLSRRAGMLAAVLALALVLPLAAMRPAAEAPRATAGPPVQAAPPVQSTAAPVATAAAPDFRWRGHIPAGRWIEIKGVIGDVRAVRASGDEVVVTAEKLGRGDVVVALPASADTRVFAETTSGDISTEFPLRVHEREYVGAELGGVIGNGGRSIELETTSGSIRLLSAGDGRAAAVPRSDLDRNAERESLRELLAELERSRAHRAERVRERIEELVRERVRVVPRPYLSRDFEGDLSRALEALPTRERLDTEALERRITEMRTRVEAMSGRIAEAWAGADFSFDIVETAEAGVVGMHPRGRDCDVTVARAAVAPAAGADVIRIRTGSGSLRIVGKPGIAQVRVHGIACAPAPDLLRQTRVSADRRGGVVEIRAEAPSGETRLDVTVVVPAHARLVVGDGAGDTEISGVSALQLRDGSGDLDLAGIRGGVRVTDSSGDLRLRNARGDVRLTDSSGAIRLERIAGDVTIEQDSSGDIYMRDVGGSVSVVEDSSGDIRVAKVGGDFVVEEDTSGSVDFWHVRGTVRIPAGE